MHIEYNDIANDGITLYLCCLAECGDTQAYFDFCEKRDCSLCNVFYGMCASVEVSDIYMCGGTVLVLAGENEL